jgi:TonB-like protein
MYFSRFFWLSSVVLLTVAPLSVHAQAVPGWSEWETVAPQGEEFSVLMPKNPSVETAKVQYHKMELTSRLYMSSLPNGPLVAIASFNGIKSNPAQYTDLQRFNSYVDAFKNWFPAKATGKDAVAKLLLVGSNTFHGYDGREYSLTIGDLTGVMHAYATKRRFYAIVSLNTKKDDAIRQKFLSSFVLPDKPADDRRANANQANNTESAEVAAEAQSNSENPAKPTSEPKRRAAPNAQGNDENTESGNQTGGGTQASANSQASNEKQKRTPINGGMLNGKAIYLPLPEVSAGEATGVVLVAVLVDEQGAVIEARPISGPPALQAAAVNAAKLARFSPTMLMGEPVRVSGTLSYNFAKAN